MDENAVKMLTEWNLKMEAEDRIPLWESGKSPDYNPAYGQREPSLVAFLPKGKSAESPQKCGAVLVCAGGGFSIKAPHEGWPICEWLNANGISAFLLDYRLTPYYLPTIIGDAKRAMRVIRHHAAEWEINPEKIGILGFSAGGQITVSISTMFDKGDPFSSDPIECMSCRPDGAVLPGYLADKPGRQGGRMAVLGQHPVGTRCHTGTGTCVFRGVQCKGWNTAGFPVGNL